MVRTRLFLHFWRGNVLGATKPCTFSTSQLPKVLRPRYFLTLLPWKRASRHNSVQFLISHLVRWLRTRRFSEPTFRPSEATNHWKTQSVATFLPFHAPALSFFSLFLWSFHFFSSPSDSSHLCFPICPYCRKFDFIFFSNMAIYAYIYIYMHIYVNSNPWWVFCLSLSIPSFHVYIYIYIYTCTQKHGDGFVWPCYILKYYIEKPGSIS